ncbi:helix-turn-helix domain-containing protein [Nonomuraea mesophila]|uniref:Helix-turn-helix domain-containing protein n=1 Tax=Nonomuraea mesophila TaxID=2530382 RepID=A0A4R5FDS0_9ACTN|nr:helix-turn-helix domain-containing protein [Nonomuraea mesophila]TDE47920.1 helix-turn-helix domain-containing protein [Nonomuraea mesophila]
MGVVSTEEVPTGERFALWREVSAKQWVPLDARCERHLESTFRAQAAFGGLGPVQAVLLTTTPLTTHRTSRLIRQSDPETFLVSCAVRGRVCGEQDGRQAELRVGDLCLRDSSHPTVTRLGRPGERPAQMLSLQFPRSLLPLSGRELRDLAAVRIPGDRGVGALTSQFLLQTAARMHEFSPSDGVRLSTLTLDVLAVALASALDAGASMPPEARRRALLAQIHAFIQQNLGDPRLTPGAIAAAHHISLRYLHRLFQQEGHTVVGWIRERRLRRCRRDLADPLLSARPINVIAARWGFASPARFSQVFRSAYGLSPAQFRRECLTVHAG